MEKYVIIGEYSNNKGTVFISNTNPICWVEQESLAKVYDCLLDAIHDVVSEYSIYKTTILGTDISYISILSLSDRTITPVINSSGELVDTDEF